MAKCPTCYGTGEIGTTDWLTKNMTKKQIAEEKAQAIAEHEQYIKTEYAREIFEEIEADLRGAIRIIKENETSEAIKQAKIECYEDDMLGYIAELKKKYTEQ